MTTFSLAWHYLKSKPLNLALNIILLSLGIAVMTLLLLSSRQLEDKINQNAQHIDLVVGAKGSPLQLILCNIFHVDFPTGNINLAEAERIAHNRLVKQAIPLALGDSYRGYRLVGTSKAYTDLYAATLQEGNWFNKPMDVVIGATVAEVSGLHPGSTFTSTHGLTVEGGHHDEHPFKVTGVLNPTHTVLDNLVLTPVESIWMMHAEAPASTNNALAIATPSRLVPSVAQGDSTKEITALLIQYRSPMGAIQLPRLINSQSKMQAASPAFETARLFTILGVGEEILTAFAYILIFISALSIFIALFNSLKERRYDLAIMRTMGATRTKLLMTVMTEGMMLTLLGCLIGLAMGHASLQMMGSWVEEIKKAGISGLVFDSMEWVILVGCLLLGLICSLLPGIQAYRTDISSVLAEH